MNLLIMGPPGAGKGSQAVIIKERYNIPHISTGAMFREAIKAKTKTGLLAKEYIDKGELVPDSVTIELVRERLQADDTKNGFLLDGFPRTIAQAQALDQILSEVGKKIDKVINLVVDEEILVIRISGRRVCKTCGETYHIVNKKPKVEEICDVCGGELIQREDDNVATVTNRIKVYYEKTRPLLNYYDDKGILINIDGSGEIEETFRYVEKIMEDANDLT